MPKIDNLEPCSRGYHIARGPQVLEWLGPELWTVEVRGTQIDHGDKLVVAQARLLKKLPWEPVMFAADCAEHVLHLFEKRFPNDNRPRRAMEAARSGEAAAEAREAAEAAAAAARAGEAAAAAEAAAARAAAAAARAVARVAAMWAREAAATRAREAAATREAREARVAAAEAAAAARGNERKWQFTHLCSILNRLTDAE